MSVLSCARRNCENVMCDRYSSFHGYICDECFDVLVARGIDTDIEEFMNCTEEGDVTTIDSREFFSNIFEEN